MAKIGARGCYELARWTWENDRYKPGDRLRYETAVLRSDGVLLRKYYRGGTYSTWKRLQYQGKRFRDLDCPGKEAAIAAVDRALVRGGWIRDRR